MRNLRFAIRSSPLSSAPWEKVTSDCSLAKARPAELKPLLNQPQADQAALGIAGFVLEQALAVGHIVTALVRSPGKLTLGSPSLRVLAGQAIDAGDVARALDGTDGVISTLGGGGSVIANSSRALSKLRTRRESSVSSFCRRFSLSAIVWVPSLG